ncbi:hypothetical protein GOZ96_25635 [Agrobacterium vitis]|uniref:hypothetical protein n=1 Tax=Agrobacterium vitis TaxID=373 RepID=UPI0013123675|nr:hypothetical protein [Agrobacterium vitis]MUZ99932.1 hypothetical protein [Agrobacterium vitis]
MIMGKVIASLTASVNGKKPANAAGGAHFRSICARLADKTIYRILTAGGYHRLPHPGPSQMSAFCKTLIFHFLAPPFPPHPTGRIAVTR